MEKIEIGEYIRTDQGEILKYNIEHEKAYIDNFLTCSHCMSERVVKHSKKLKDLIEIKDIVRVHNLKGDIFDFTIEIFDDKTMIDLQLALDNNELKLLSILTKEQYTQNCYVMEVKDE